MRPEKDPLARAEINADAHAEKLEAVARAFAAGRATRAELLDAAKKATNAAHAVGRAMKAAGMNGGTR